MSFNSRWTSLAQVQQRTALALLMCVLVLTGCDKKDLVLWSPDGERVAVIASDGLRVGDETGKLSAPVVKNAVLCRWLPDSGHAMVDVGTPTQHWKDINDVLSTDERKTVIRVAERIWASRAVPQAAPEDFSSREREREAEAVLYLMYTRGADQTKTRLHNLLGKENEISPVIINILQVIDLKSKNPPKPVVVLRTTQTINDVRIAPNGNLAAVCIGDESPYDLLIVPLQGGKRAAKQIESQAGCPDWSADSKSIFYIKSGNEGTTQSCEAWISRLEVADANGHVLPKLGDAKKLVQVLAEDASRVRYMPDDSIIFDAKQRTYPSVVKSDDPHPCLFRLSSDFQDLEPIARSTELPGGAMEYFEPNRDGTKIVVPGNKGAIAVLDLSSGKITTIEKSGPHDLKFAPQWRTNDELCYPARNATKSGKEHDIDVILQSMSVPDRRVVLSKDWSAKSCEFLRDNESDKPKQSPRNTRARSNKPTAKGK